MPKPIDLSGLKYGRLTAIKADGFIRFGSGTKLIWLCKCQCGKSIKVTTGSLRSGNTKSCGCFRDEEIRKSSNKNSTHKMSQTELYGSWSAMITRCYNPKCEKFSLYGGRGVVACEFLRASPKNLKLILGKRPEKMSLDRINSEGNYSCGQCAQCLKSGWPKNIRWATQKLQNRNRRDNKKITIKGITKCLPDWADFAGINKGTLNHRLILGWSHDDLLAPVQNHSKN
jgi:hypothetical protein